MNRRTILKALAAIPFVKYLNPRPSIYSPGFRDKVGNNHGIIESVHSWPKALSAEEIKRMYVSGNLAASAEKVNIEHPLNK